MVRVGELEYGVIVDDVQAKQKIQSVGQEFKTLGTSTQQTTQQLNQISPSLQRINQESQKTVTETKGLGTVFKDNVLAIGNVVSGVISLVSQYTALQRAQNLIQRFTNIEIGLRNRVTDLTNKHAETVKKYGTNSSEAAKSQRDLTLVTDKHRVAADRLEIMQQSLNERMAQFAVNILPAIVQAGSGTVSIFNNLQKAGVGATKTTAALTGETAQFSGEMINTAATVEGAAAETFAAAEAHKLFKNATTGSSAATNIDSTAKVLNTRTTNVLTAAKVNEARATDALAVSQARATTSTTVFRSAQFTLTPVLLNNARTTGVLTAQNTALVGGMRGFRIAGIAVLPVLKVIGIALAAGAAAALTYRGNILGFRDIMDSVGKTVGDAIPELKGFLDLVKDLALAFPNLGKMWNIFKNSLVNTFPILKELPLIGGLFKDAGKNVDEFGETSVDALDETKEAMNELKKAGGDLIQTLAFADKGERKDLLSMLGIKGGAKNRFKDTLDDIEQFSKRMKRVGEVLKFTLKLPELEKVFDIPKSVTKKMAFTLEDVFRDAGKETKFKGLFDELADSIRVEAERGGTKLPEVIADFALDHPEILAALEAVGLPDIAGQIKTLMDTEAKKLNALGTKGELLGGQKFLLNLIPGVDKTEEGEEKTAIDKILDKFRTGLDDFVDTDLVAFVKDLTGVDFGPVAITWQKGLIDPVVQGLMALPSSVTAWAGVMAESFGTRWAAIQTSVIDPIVKGWQALVSSAAAWGATIQKSFSDAWKATGEFFAPIIDPVVKAWQVISNAAAPWGKAIADFFSKAFDVLGPIFKPIVDPVIKGWQQLAESAGHWAKTISDAFAKQFSIPGMASTGIGAGAGLLQGAFGEEVDFSNSRFNQKMFETFNRKLEIFEENNKQEILDTLTQHANDGVDTVKKWWGSIFPSAFGAMEDVPGPGGGLPGTWSSEHSMLKMSAGDKGEEEKPLFGGAGFADMGAADMEAWFPGLASAVEQAKAKMLEIVLTTVTTAQGIQKAFNTSIQNIAGLMNMLASHWGQVGIGIIATATSVSQVAAESFNTLIQNTAGLMNMLASHWNSQGSNMIGTSKNISVESNKIFKQMVQNAAGNLTALANHWTEQGANMIETAKSVAKAVNKELAKIKDVDVTITFSARFSGAPRSAILSRIAQGGTFTSLAKGGVISAARGFTTNGPQLALIGDNPGGRETVAVIPHNDPWPTKSLLDKQFGESGGGGGAGKTPAIIYITIGGKTLRQEVELVMGESVRAFMP